jgi:hypothetical protein
MYSFYELFACYAKHLDRYFSTLRPEDRDFCISGFHIVLMDGLNSIAQERYHSPSPDHALTGEQLEMMLSPLADAYREYVAEDSLRHTLYRFNYPVSIYAPTPDKHPSQYEIFKQCCPLSEEVDG